MATAEQSISNNLGWIKLHRKLLDNPILSDPNALAIFIWLLLRANRKTGQAKFGRKWASEELDMNEYTFYDAVQRLQNKYEIVILTTEKTTIKYTVATITNWHIYQEDHRDDHIPTTIKPHSTISKEVKKDINTTHSRCPNKLGHRVCLETISEIEKEFGKKFLNYPKQINAYHRLLRSGFEDEDIERVVNRFDSDPFWQEKGWDLMDVLNVISKGGEKYVSSKTK